jgi:hypothetical protein
MKRTNYKFTTAVCGQNHVCKTASPPAAPAIATKYQSSLSLSLSLVQPKQAAGPMNDDDLLCVCETVNV